MKKAITSAAITAAVMAKAARERLRGGTGWERAALGDVTRRS